ncbi:MAG: hypothetical protein WCH43_07380 [Verrucomicrobiota bacterium]
MLQLFGICLVAIIAGWLAMVYFMGRLKQIQHVSTRYLEGVRNRELCECVAGPLSSLIDAGVLNLKGRWELNAVRRQIRKHGAKDPGTLAGVPAGDLYGFFRFTQEHGLSVSNSESAVFSIAAFRSAREVIAHRK